jgi:hypothetical protein
MEIRRPAAARMLSRTGYTFDADRESVLHATCRVIHANDSVEVLPEDRVTVNDARDDNPLITLEHKRAFSWILPELKSGDIIETTFHRLRRGTVHAGLSWPSSALPICPPSMPCYRAEVYVASSPDLELRVRTVNCDSIVKEALDEPRRPTVCARVDRHVPTTSTALDNESALLAPWIVIGPAHATWRDLACLTRQSLLGEHADDALPRRLEEIIDLNQDPAVALEKCFYVLRDDLKYAATQAGKGRIGVSGRADQILESGVGDCADKSFLMHLVCRELGLDHDLLVFDTSTGQLCEEVPADTFDHVLVRAVLDGRELWFDAADRFGMFGSAPLSLQGMKGLALDDQGTIVRVPEDEPEANLMLIREHLDHFEDHMLAGTIEIEAHGTNGRMLEEYLKSHSLDARDKTRGNSMALMPTFPELSLKSLEVHSHTTHSRVFRASGDHARGRLSRLTRSERSIARLAWISPNLPFWEWPDRDRSKMVWAGMPMIFRVEVELGPAVASELVDRSVLAEVDNELFAVRENVTEENGSLRILREVVLRKGRVEAPLTGLMPALTESVARACTLMLHFDRAAN